VVRELKSLGVEVIFEKEKISSLNGDCELMLSVLSSFAQEESKNVSDNIKWRYKRKFEQGEVTDCYYIEGIHSPIVTKDIWEEAQRHIQSRFIGNVETEKHQNRYPLTGLLFCSKCQATLRRRTWNSKYACQKIVWQCSRYINEGKNSCSGTVIEDDVISRMNIRKKTVMRRLV